MEAAVRVCSVKETRREIRVRAHVQGDPDSVRSLLTSWCFYRALYIWHIKLRTSKRSHLGESSNPGAASGTSVMTDSTEAAFRQFDYRRVKSCLSVLQNTSKLPNKQVGVIKRIGDGDFVTSRSETVAARSEMFTYIYIL